MATWAAVGVLILVAWAGVDVFTIIAFPKRTRHHANDPD